MRGIDFNDESHREVLTHDFPRFHPLFDYPEDGNETSPLRTFFSNNTQFGWQDARALFVLMHTWRPKRIVEVGSGFSSLLIADVNRRWFDSAIDVTCIEPYPRAFLRSGIPGISRLLELRVQDVAPEEFERLEAGDVLFIDSSHVRSWYTRSGARFAVGPVRLRTVVYLPSDISAAGARPGLSVRVQSRHKDAGRA